MRHLQRMGWALLLSALASTLSSAAWAVEWSPDNNINATGQVRTWTSTSSGEDSGILNCKGTCICDNTHATTSVTVYRVGSTGTKMTGDYWKAPAATNCSDLTLDQCSTVQVSGGRFIMDPDSAAVATMECRGVAGD